MNNQEFANKEEMKIVFDNDEAVDAAELELWSPNAATNWCLLLTPMFSSTLLIKNWRAMGNDAEAKKGIYWQVAYAIPLAINLVVPVIPFKAFAVYMLVWYFVYARKQIKFVKSDIGEQYSRRRWAKPILIAVGVIIAYAVIGGCIQLALGNIE